MEFRDLKLQYQQYKEEIGVAIQKVLDSTSFIEGEEVGFFEKTLAEYIGVKHCVTCANGTDALTLTMMLWNIRQGDAVFIPNFTFFATGEIVSFMGATPIFVDVDKDTFNIDTAKLEEAVKYTLKEGKLNPKVVIPVDLFGLPANHYEIKRIAQKYELLILEDAAQGMCGSIGDRKNGSFGDVSITSFFPSKPLGCYGDGGAIFTNNDNYAELLRSYKVHGRGADKYDNIRIGMNSRLDTIQAAILNVKLTVFIKHELDDVIKIAKAYDENLEDIVQTPVIPDEYISSFAQYTIKLKDKNERDRIQIKLSERGIPSIVYYNKPMNRQKVFTGLGNANDRFEVSDELSERVLSLPIHPYMNKSEVLFISKVIKDDIKRSK